MGLVAIAPYGLGAASARIRVHEWLTRLGTPYVSHTYIGSSDASPGRLLRNLPAVARAERTLRSLDLSDSTLLLHREASPVSSGGLEVKLLCASTRSVFDFDDALQWDVRDGLRGIVAKPRKLERCVQRSDVVVAGNDLLADWATRFGKEVHMVPSCVEPAAYTRKASYEQVRETPTICWVGSPSTEKYLLLVAEPLLRFHAETGARLIVVSAGNSDLGPLNRMSLRVDWNPETLASVMTSCDFAIAPVASNLYELGKCAYKVLQYGCAGLPVVGSPVGAARHVLRHLGAMAAVTAEDWLVAMSDLAGASSAERAAAGRASALGVEVHYSFSAWHSTMLGLLGLDPAG